MTTNKKKRTIGSLKRELIKLTAEVNLAVLVLREKLGGMEDDA